MSKDFWIEKFKKEAIPIIIQNFKPEKILLFGSRITGKANEDSDIDAIIVSKTFLSIPFIKRMSLVLQKIRFEKHIDFICYSPDEFQDMKNKSAVLMDALENGEFVNV